MSTSRYSYGRREDRFWAPFHELGRIRADADLSRLKLEVAAGVKLAAAEIKRTWDIPVEGENGMEFQNQRIAEQLYSDYELIEASDYNVGPEHIPVFYDLFIEQAETLDLQTFDESMRYDDPQGSYFAELTFGVNACFRELVANHLADTFIEILNAMSKEVENV